MQSSGLVLAGLGMVAVGTVGRMALRHARELKQAGDAVKKGIDSALPAGMMSKYYTGGFDQKMSKFEAAKILGISPQASKSRLKDAHKKIMIANHPDKGGSPYLAAKINEAKELLDNPHRHK